jgi:hypothetical protein
MQIAAKYKSAVYTPDFEILSGAIELYLAKSTNKKAPIDWAQILKHKY